MKKTTKIVTLILSAILLIGCVVGITAFADETPTVAIKYKNLAYEGAIQVLYAVDAQNVPDGAAVRMYFYDAEPEDGAAPAYVKDAYTAEELIIGGVKYYAFFSYGVAPKDMRKTIYAVPVIVDGDTVVAKGDAVAYSIYNYAINMFSKSPLADQKTLYTKLLDYGASVQRILLGTDSYTEADLALAGGYADEYCGVKVSTIVDGSIAEEGEFLGYFAPGTAVELSADLYHEGAMFTGFTNTKREMVGDYAATATAYTSEPGVAGFYKTYNSNISVNDYTEGIIHGSNTYAYIDSVGYTNNYITGKTGNNEIVNYGTAEAPNYALKHSHTDGVESGSIQFIYGTRAKAYVFESDFYFGGVTGTTNADYWQGRIGFVSNLTAGRNSEKNYSVYTFLEAKEGGDMSISKAKLPVGKWVRIRFEYVPLGYFNGAYRGTMRIYQDGVLVSTINQSTDVDNSDCLRFDIGTRTSGNAGGWTMMLDNTLCYTITEDYYGKGLYKDLADTYDSDKTYTNATVVEEIGGNKVLSFVKKDGKSPAMTFNTDSTEFGTTYVFDTDLMWEEMPIADYGRTWIGRFGFVSEYTDNYNEDDKYVRSNSMAASPAHGILYGLSTSGSLSTNTIRDTVKLNPGTWYNLRIEYTNLGVDTDGFYHGNQKVYINGKLIKDVTQKEVMMSRYQGTRGVIKNTVGLKAFSFGTLGLNSASMKFDNTFIGAIGDITGYRINDFANTVNATSSNPRLSLATSTEDCVSEQTIVANPLATDTKSAANNVLKVVTDNSVTTQAVNTITHSTTEYTPAASGVYELSYDMLFDPSSTLPATDNIIQQFVVDGGTGYVTLYRLTHTGDGVVSFNAETGGSGGGKGGLIGSATLLDGKWHNIKFVYYKNGTDSALAIYVDDELVGAKANIYYQTKGAVTDIVPINKYVWRIKPYAPSGDATSATYYFDNVSSLFKGPVPEVIPELAPKN